MILRLFVFLALLLAGASARAQGVIIPQSSTAIEGSHIFCTAQCKIFSMSLTTGSSAGYLMLFDLNSVPADGALVTAPRYCWYFPATSSVGYTWPLGGPGAQAAQGAQFVNGLTLVFSTGADCLHKTLSATAFFTVQVQ